MSSGSSEGKGRGDTAAQSERGSDTVPRDSGEFLLVDAVGLAYSARGGRIVVHYPESGSDDGDAPRYTTGFPIGQIPESYWTDPPNAITGQRAELWRRLLDADAARGV